MNLAFGLHFNDLYEREGLLRVDRAFLGFLAEIDAALRDRLVAARAKLPAGKEESELLVALAPHVEDFIAKLFGIEAEARALAGRHHELAPLYSVKRLFVQRRALHKVKPEDARPDGFAFSTELDFARRVTAWLADEKNHEQELEGAARYAAWATTTPEGKAKHRAGVLFKAPRKLDFMRLVPVHTETDKGYSEHSLLHLREREGFALTDPGTDLVGAMDEGNYCIWGHEQGKGSCSKGLKEKAPSESFKKTVLGVQLAGCPLEEKISEFQMVKARGEPLAALAMIAVDNPLSAGTGHRICNDCMKSCIYQKQTPVNIPQIETSILSDVLQLPYGFEIYSLLSRWNPLHLRRPYPLAYNGKNVLVVGMGPAGYTLAHHLLNEGFGVVGVDGLRIEPLSVRMRGAKRRVPQPVKDINDVTGPLDRRTILGFGGVSEYGITVRWDKNFLDINYLLLMRRKKFRLYDGIRFGGTVTLEDAWNLGFDHVAICAGAGKPTLVSAKNNLLRGVRQASDFLMGLQATGAYKANSLANLQLRLPAVVIGGGLTAIDTATEMQAYYVVQVEKTLDRYDRLVWKIGEEAIWAKLDAEEREIVETWLKHGRAIRAERSAAAAAGRL